MSAPDYKDLVVKEVTFLHQPPDAPYFISFSNQTGGKIVINIADGSVAIEGLTPPQAALEFWELVTQAFPEVRRKIKESGE